jgi:hydrogenase maturation protein HypF
MERVADVALSGGVFQNAILADELPRRLAALGLRAHVHRRVPPNDGGLAFGQLAIVAARGGA